jgi:hypothetical protein
VWLPLAKVVVPRPEFRVQASGFFDVMFWVHLRGFSDWIFR